MTLPTSISPGDPGHIADHDEIGTLLGAAAAGSFSIGMIAQGTFAARPAAGHQGLFYVATDRGNALYYDTGAAWVAMNADSSLFVQTETFSDSGTTSLSSTSATMYTKSPTLPSGWVSMDVVVEGFMTLQYGNDSGFRRAVCQVKVDGTAAGQLSNAFWEDIAASAVNRAQDVHLRNTGTGKTGTVTLLVVANLNQPGASGTPGTDHVSAIDLYMTCTKYRRS